jgi:hypothetical protein
MDFAEIDVREVEQSLKMGEETLSISGEVPLEYSGKLTNLFERIVELLACGAQETKRFDNNL